MKLKQEITQLQERIQYLETLIHSEIVLDFIRNFNTNDLDTIYEALADYKEPIIHRYSTYDKYETMTKIKELMQRL